MHRCEVCGAEVGKIRMQNKGDAVVNLCPLPYREGQGKELITADGRRVQAVSCFPQNAAGTAYLEHRHETNK